MSSDALHWHIIIEDHPKLMIIDQTVQIRISYRLREAANWMVDKNRVLNRKGKTTTLHPCYVAADKVTVTSSFQAGTFKFMSRELCSK